MGRKVLSYRNSMEIRVSELRDSRNREDYLAFYSKIFSGNLKLKKFPYYITYCPFHKDKKTPNLYINIINGRYHCFACTAKGSYSDFILSNALKNNFLQIPKLTDKNRIEQLDKYSNKKELSELDLAVENNKAEDAHKLLLRHTMALKRLWENKGINLSTINKYKIGFINGTYAIPIYDRVGKIACLKQHKLRSTKGCTNQIYPWEAVLHNPSPYVSLVEGEFDTHICRQNGINSCTQIFGVGGWEEYFNRYFYRKTAYILYDNDLAGEKGMEKVWENLKNTRVDIKFPKWPDFMKEKEDHVDYFVKYKQTAKNYWNLLKNAGNSFKPYKTTISTR